MLNSLASFISTSPRGIRRGSLSSRDIAEFDTLALRACSRADRGDLASNVLSMLEKVMVVIMVAFSLPVEAIVTYLAGVVNRQL